MCAADGYSSPRTYLSQTVVALPDFEKGPGPPFGEVSVVVVIQRASKERLLHRRRAYVGIYARGAPRHDGFARRRNVWADQYYGARPAVVARFALSDPPV